MTDSGLPGRTSGRGARRRRTPASAPAAGSLLLAMLTLALIGWTTTDSPVARSPVDAQDYEIAGISVELALQEDGSYRVEERIRFVYGPATFTRGYRTIPTRGLDAITAVSVTSPDTRIDAVESGSDGRTFEIRWEYPERSEPATFVLSYRVDGALIEDDGENIIAWDPVGDAWEVPIEGLEAAVSLPFGELAGGEIRLEPGSDGELERSDGGWTARFAVDRLDARTGYGLRVRFPARLAGRQPVETDERAIALGFMLFLLGLVPGLVLLGAWRQPDAPERGTRDTPPDAPLPHVAYLAAGESGSASAVTRPLCGAMLVDLARRGRVSLRRFRKKAGDAREDEKLEVVVRGGAHGTKGGPGPGPRDDGALSALETELLGELAKYETFDEFQSKSGAFQRRWHRAIRRELVGAGLLEDRSRRSSWTMLAALVPIVALVGLEGTLPDGAPPPAIGLALGLAGGIAVAAIGRFPRTERGAALLSQARGFFEWLRASIESARESEPAEAVRLLAEHLHWLMLDPKVDREWFDEAEQALRRAAADGEVPEWIRETVDPRDADGAAAAMLPIYLAAAVSSSSPSGGGVAGTATAGVGASAGVGGGGGGVG